MNHNGSKADMDEHKIKSFRQINADEHWYWEYYKEFFIHLKSENDKIHNSLIIRVYLCPFDEEI